MQYILIEYTKGIEQQAYQVIDNGVVVEMRDLDGELIVFDPDTAYESHVVDDSPPTPEWAA